MTVSPLQCIISVPSLLIHSERGIDVFVIDYRDKRPLNEQVADKLQTLILAGALPAESRLPSVRELAMQLSINPNTVQRAYSELERRGLIYPVKGKGNFVSGSAGIAERKQQEARHALVSALEACLSAGLTRQEALEAAAAWAKEEER